MKKRTRRYRYKRKKSNMGLFGFCCMILSIIIVLIMFLPTKKSDLTVNVNETDTMSEITETGENGKEKNDLDAKSASAIYHSGYNDITFSEREAEKLLSAISDDGNIVTQDYFSKNATASAGSIYIRNTTKEHNVKIEEYLNKKVFADVKKGAPAVLVYHTHSSESYQIIENTFYSENLSADAETLGVIRAGDALCRKIESYGYEVIHDRTVYDTSYSGAFDRSRENVSEILRANPSIQIVIDLHRDSISRKDGSKIKTVTVKDGKKLAQIQITAGCEEGSVKNFPNWEKNLTFALHLQKALVDLEPHIARPLLFCTRKYNLDLVPCAVNIDIGTEANTVREAVYSAEILGDAVAAILKECET